MGAGWRGGRESWLRWDTGGRGVAVAVTVSEWNVGAQALSRVLIPESWLANDTMKLIKAIIKVFPPADTWRLPVTRGDK